MWGRRVTREGGRLPSDEGRWAFVGQLLGPSCPKEVAVWLLRDQGKVICGRLIRGCPCAGPTVLLRTEPLAVISLPGDGHLWFSVQPPCCVVSACLTLPVSVDCLADQLASLDGSQGTVVG